MEKEIEERFDQIYALLKEIEARENRNDSSSIPSRSGAGGTEEIQNGI